LEGDGDGGTIPNAMREGAIRHFEGITIDATQWPFVLWESAPRRVSDRAFADAMTWVQELSETTPPGEKWFLLTDLSRLEEAAPASQRKYAADFLNRNGDLIRRASAAAGIVAKSAVVRGGITAVFWIRPPPIETRVVATREEGILYGIAMIEKACPPLPPHLIELRAKLTAPRAAAR
jgi:hypothetical protein